MSQFRSPICVALDTPDVTQASELAQALKAHVGLVKIGMAFFYANGTAGYQSVARAGIPIFLDLKLHDIPNTVHDGLTSLMKLDPAPAIVNVHATGGPAMMRAAAKAVAGQSRLIAVTVMTSLLDDDLSAAGFAKDRNTAQHAVSLAKLGRDCGVKGVVCSAHDISAIKEACGRDFMTVVPGIRPVDAAVQDQKRIATPRAACDAGADVIVIGRPITTADDPVRAAQAIAGELAESLSEKS